MIQNKRTNKNYLTKKHQKNKQKIKIKKSNKETKTEKINNEKQKPEMQKIKSNNETAIKQQNIKKNRKKGTID